MVSIKDVAKHAGVAISTVSKVLNNYPNISEATRKKVNAAVEELNFVPNSVAAALSSKNAGRVALMIDLNVTSQAIDEIAMRYISGAITKAMELNLDVITLFVFMFREKNVEELIRYLQSQSITGIIIYGAAEDDHMLQELIASEKFKCVVIDDNHVSENISSVSIDHKKAQYEVARGLIEETNVILVVSQPDRAKDRKGNLIPIGGGSIDNKSTLKIDKYIINLVKKDIVNVLFIPTASGDFEPYILKFKDYYNSLNCKVDTLLLSRTTNDNLIRSKIFSSDIIYIGGGNTAKMMRIFKRTKVNEYLKTAYEKGIVLTGLSAGAMVYFTNGYSDSNRSTNPNASLCEVKCLNLIPYCFCPHYNEEERKSFDEFVVKRFENFFVLYNFRKN